MADNKLNLFVKFTGVDKLSGSIKNMIGTSRTGQRSIRDMQREVKLMEKDLGRVRRELSSGSVKGGLIMAERELADAIGKTNREIDRQKRKLERVANIRSRAGAVAGMAGRAGAVASVAITAPLVALSASVGRLAQDAKGMRNAANVAGMGFEQFQRDAYAARSVGIEYDKFGDILKDTQDKIGDFSANGGGEMADFFENVAPKVGVTAKSFQNLSGSQALQLYYDSLVKAGVSQKEMVFYMEAIADEGSGLIPILANNGKAMKELGSQAAVISAKDAAGLKEYTDAQMRLGNATTRLQIALARSGLIDTMVWIADKGAAAALWFGTLSPGVQKVAVVLGMVAAAAGPVLIFFGAVASAVATLAPVFATVGAVIGGIPLVIALVAAGLAALAYTVYANWDAIKGALQAGWAEVKGFFSGLPEWMKSIGSMMMQGLLMALNPALLADKLIGIAKSGITAFKNFFGIKSPSRLFMQMGGHINEGLGIGLERGRGRPVRAVGRMAGAVAGAGAMALSPTAAAARPTPQPARKVEIHIHQQPGENSEALARRVAELVEKAQQQKALRSYGDEF